MARYLVTGPTSLSGHVSICGNKNSILKLMAASLLTDQPTTITNVPRIRDVAVMAEILKSLGAKVKGLETGSLTIEASRVDSFTVPGELAVKIRASIMLLAPLLVRFGQVRLGFPGGDVIGKRAIGTHFDALSRLGAKFRIEDNTIVGSVPHPSPQTDVFLDEASVTATENTLIMAAGRPQTTTIFNAACEPHVGDLGRFLEQMGAQITGLGTNTITIVGTQNRRGVADFAIGSDYIDAGTFAIAAAASGGAITISPILPQDVWMLLLYLSRFNVQFRWPKPDTLEILPSQLRVDPERQGIRQKFQTRPWPGFPTDLMSPLIVLATQTRGSVLLHDWMYETRMFFTDKLVSMGANVTLCDPHRVIVTGPTPLRGHHLTSPDIRAGMSLLIAAICATGRSEIDHVEVIERGYESPAERLTALGAQIERDDREH